jgi:antitoxin MazE
MGTVKTNVVKIGNSQGIRIPKAILEQCHLNRNVELEPRSNHLVVRSAAKPRAGWDEAFQAMAQRGDDTILDGDTFVETSWEKDEWQW